jgi:hypothetical protein
LISFNFDSNWMDQKTNLWKMCIILRRIFSHNSFINFSKSGSRHFLYDLSKSISSIFPFPPSGLFDAPPSQE